MTDFRERYKRIGIGREDMAANRALRSQRRDEARRDARTEHFSLRRDMDMEMQHDEDDNVAQVETKQKDDRFNHEEASKKNIDEDVEEGVKKRLLQLEKWREERNRRRLQEKKRAKPVFKVGVVHHRVYSPPLTKDPVPQPPAKLCKSKEIHHHNPEPPPKRVTRATEKRLAVKAVSSKQKREDLRTKRKEKEKVQAKVKNREDEQSPLAPNDFQFKAPLGVTAMPIFGRQALEATKIDEILSNPSDVSSSINEFGKGLSSASDSVFHTKDHSIILSKSSSRRSNLNALHSNPCDSSTAKSFNNSMNESSVEAVTLKLSMDDQEILDDQQSMSKINSTVADDEKSKRRSRIFIPPSEAVINTCEDQEMKETEGDVTISKSTTKSPTTRRSSRTIMKKSKSIESPFKSTSFTVQNHEMQDQANLSNSKSIIFTADTSALRQKKTKSPGRRKSTKDFAPSQIDDFEQNIAAAEQMDTDTLEVEKMIEFSDTNTSHNDSLNSKQNKQTVNRRRSTRIVSEETTNAKDFSYMLEDQEILENQENINYNAKNLIDYSISDLSKISSPIRKSMRFTGNLQDQSLMKFSPRNSIRPQTVNSPKQSSMFRATLTNESPKDGVNQSIKKLSTTEIDIMTHNTSEPTNQIIFEKSDDLNQSLNMLLPKDSTPDRPPAFFSPYVVASRGKDRVRKEVQRRRFSQPLSAEIPTKETVMQTLNISVEEEERTAQYYKFILDKEIERLNEICNTWNVIKEDPTTPEDIHYEIQAAVGQTQLLVNKKFERFRSLVLDCETGKGEMLVTCKDLQGFWEMMYMEIKDCDNRFNRLEGMKTKNWIVEETEEEKKEKITKKKPVAAKKPAAKKKPVAAKSSLRAHIMAARKKKMEGKDGNDDIELKEAAVVLQDITEEVAKDVGTPPKNIRRSTSTPKSTNKWQSLLKKVQLSQTRKSTTSPLIVMKLSQMCKTPEVQLDDSIIYINSDRTPAKSILKSAKEELMGSVAKSTYKVFFKEQPTEFREFESNIENDNEVMNLDNLEEYKEPIERRLDFGSDSFNYSHLEDEEKRDQRETEKHTDSVTTSPLNTTPKDKFIKVPKIIVTGASPLISISPLSLQDKKEKSPLKKNARTKKTISFKDESDDGSTRNLRVRKLSAPGTPRPKPKNSKCNVHEDLDMDVDNSCLDSCEDSPDSTSQQLQSRQLYMNAEGIICEKIISVQKDTPRTSTLRRVNSEAIRRTTRSNKIKDSEPEAPSSPKPKRRNFIEVVIDSPTSPANINVSKSRKSSSTLRLKNSKLSEVNTILTEDDANKTFQGEGTPKSSKKTPKVGKTPKSNSLDLKENEKETATVKLKRSKSLNTTKVNALTNESIKSETLRTRRTDSRLDKAKVALENSKTEVLTPSLKRKHSKKPQENVESDEQETDEDVNNRVKVSRTSSIKRRNSKKYLDSVENGEPQMNKSSQNEISTPTSRRKSLRISKSIHEK